MRFLMSKLLLTAAVVLTAMASPVGAASIIYSNFGPAYSYDPNKGATLGVTSAGHTSDVAESFTVTGTSSTFGSFTLAVGLISGPNELDVSLMTDASGLPGTALESFHFSNEMKPFGATDSLLTANSVLHPLLLVGQQYWLAAFATSPTTAAWNDNSIGVQTTGAERQDQGPWFAVTNPDGTPAFQINGVPEPSTIVMISTAVPLALCNWWRSAAALHECGSRASDPSRLRH